MRRTLAHLALAAGVLACHPDRPPQPPPPPPSLTAPARICSSPAPAEPCFAAETIEAWLRHPELRILDVGEPPTGIQETRVLTLAAPTGRGPVVFRAKWRSLATTTTINVPRKELVAYALQKRLLPPHAYVVPPTAGHCFEIGAYRARVDPDASPSTEGLGCVFGFLSYWLEDVVDLGTAAEDGWFADAHSALDSDLRRRYPSYRRSLAAANLLAYLIDHADSHPKQFVIRPHPKRPALYLVDNSMAFDSKQNTDLKNHDWSQIKLEAYPRALVERLRALTPADLDALAVLEEYRVEAGQLVAIRPRTAAPADLRERGLRWVDGRLQVGMRRSEIDALSVRLDDLRARFDHGALGVE